MTDKHLSTQFDSELNSLSSRVMELGGLVESQIRDAAQALAGLDVHIAGGVLATEDRVNELEVDIDRELSSVIARRQPTARDLRLLMAISRITANLERVGDEAERIARMVRSIAGKDGNGGALPTGELGVAADLASRQLRRALDAFARLDTAAAVATVKDDDLLDREFDGFVRKLVASMMQDPRTIASGLDLLFVAKALERIGDHASNIAESIIYVVKGADVRHRSIASIESALKKP